MAGPIDTALRYAPTLRHHRPVQLAGRVAAKGRRRLRWDDVPEPPTDLRARGLRPHTPFLTHDPWNDADSVRRGRFTFLNETRDLGRPVDWSAPGAPLLWRFNLHYGHYLDLLPEADALALVREWIAANPVGEGVGWHPYPTALRLIALTKRGLPGTDVDRSLYRQAAWLYRTLEVYHPGNHLLENARALALAGRYFEGQGEAGRWLRRGLAIFRREVSEQVLPDGGYFERSPMYHALMLEGALDLLNVLPNDHPDRPLLADTAARMRDYLASIRHPDGEIPLFNDATLEIAPPASALLGYAARLLDGEPTIQRAFLDTGRFVLTSRDAWVIVDGGPIGPDHLPAHAHADVFSFEASFGGHRFVVDTGVFEYTAGPNRSHDRSTAAHNTVVIDGVDQAECWASFRVARRYPPENVMFTEDDAGSTFAGTFRGYGKLLGDGLVHRRRVAVQHGRLAVEDEVTGRGSHRVESRLHLHPAVTVTPDGDALRLGRDGVEVVLTAKGAAFREEPSRYSPRFGVAEPNRCLVLAHDGPLPVRFAYTLTPVR